MFAFRHKRASSYTAELRLSFVYCAPDIENTQLTRFAPEPQKHTKHELLTEQPQRYMIAAVSHEPRTRDLFNNGPFRSYSFTVLRIEASSKTSLQLDCAIYKRGTREKQINT